MSELTPAKRETIKLIHLGYRSLEIANEIANKFDLLSSAENELFLHIENTRREIAEFRARAPALAELGFQNGHSWKDVVSALEATGLLTSGDVVQFCVRARDKVAGEQALK